MIVRNGILANNFNMLVKAFKDANPDLTHNISQKKVKQYYDRIKNKPDGDKLTLEKKVTNFTRKLSANVLLHNPFGTHLSEKV